MTYLELYPRVSVEGTKAILSTFTSVSLEQLETIYKLVDSVAAGNTEAGADEPIQLFRANSGRFVVEIGLTGPTIYLFNPSGIGNIYNSNHTAFICRCVEYGAIRPIEGIEELSYIVRTEIETLEQSK